MKKRRSLKSSFKKFIKSLGPGLVTGASDDDPSGIATYSQAGAMFGLATLWAAWITFPLMASIQETCARIGMVTSEGLMTNIKKHYPKSIMFLMLLFSFPAIILNIGADIAGMGAVANLLIPAVPAFGFAILFTLIMLVLIIYLPYQKVAAVLKYLCVFLLLYIFVPFLTKVDWIAVFKSTFIPHIQFNKSYINMLVAILGTTISPYLFFWQATMEAEDRRHTKSGIMVDKMMVDEEKKDVAFGMLLSNIVMFFIILTTGTVLFQNGIHHIDTVEQAAKALEPVAGKFSYLLFALGVIGTGFLAIPVLSGSLSYIISATFGWQSGLDQKYHQAKPFYIVIVLSLLLGLSIIFMGISPIQALIYTAILYGLTAPVLIVLILFISNNKKIMGKYCSGKISNTLNVICFLFMSVAAGLMVYFQIKG